MKNFKKSQIPNDPLFFSTHFGIFSFAPISTNPQGHVKSVTIYTPIPLISQEPIFTSFEVIRLKKMRQIRILKWIWRKSQNLATLSKFLLENEISRKPFKMLATGYVWFIYGPRDILTFIQKWPNIKSMRIMIRK